MIRILRSKIIMFEEECNERLFVKVPSLFDLFLFLGELYFGSVASFVGIVFLVISYICPYWLQSWEDTQSPFVRMGLWEFCFFKFRHPDYQFDHLFHGCHAIYGEEYRLIREKLLPGWLMVVQLFMTVALISSLLGQLVSISLLLRSPLEWILRFEAHITRILLGLNVFSGKICPNSWFVLICRVTRVGFFQVLWFSCLWSFLELNAGIEIGFCIQITIL